MMLPHTYKCAPVKAHTREAWCGGWQSSLPEQPWSGWADEVQQLARAAKRLDAPFALHASAFWRVRACVRGCVGGRARVLAGWVGGWVGGVWWW